MSRREKKMRTKRKSIKKDEDKEEKEKPSAGMFDLIYSKHISYTAKVKEERINQEKSKLNY